MRKKYYLHDNWKVKIYNDSESYLLENQIKKSVREWFNATVPGTIHTDLLKAKKIVEPFFSDNEKRLSWIAESDWLYQTEFDLPENMPQQEIYLVFDGLDTLVHIELNGQMIGKTDNMFRRHRFAISHIGKSTGNQLRVFFKSPMAAGRELIDRYGHLFTARNEERVYLRKAQYSFGWDWGPAFPTAGIWRPVYLEYVDKAWIASVRFDTLELNESTASVVIKVDLGGHLDGEYELNCTLAYKDKVVNEIRSFSNSGLVEVEMTVQNPALWWPSGYGDQALYDLDVSLSHKGNVIDRSQQHVGIRIVKLIIEEDKRNVFYFRINNKPVYIKGSNWIPSDSFIPRIKKETYKRLLSMAKESGMNMIRVWGGGIYEQPDFYKLCDKYGLLVWQDFMFACSSYPENEFYIKNIRQEVREIVAELQHHPSIAVWCGNNENEWMWYRVKKNSYINMPGYKIFHEDLNNIVQEMDPLRPYWPTTPFGLDEDPNAVFSGNRHSWEIWSWWVDYLNVEEDRSLFVTEFGFQGPANIDTLNSVLEKKNRNVQDEIFEFHNKQIEGNERLFRFLAEHLPVQTNWEDFIYLTQLNQGFALKTCLEHWRWCWPETAGSIIWQLNDCWPVSSWSLIDSHLIPKLAYYFVKNIFADPVILLKKTNNQIGVTLSNDTINTISASFEHLFFDLSGNRIINRDIQDVLIPAHGKIRIDELTVMDYVTSENWLLITSLYDGNNQLINRNYLASKRWKHLKISPSDITIVKTTENKISLTANSITLFADLYHEAMTFSEKGFILLPGENKELEIVSANPDKINADDLKIFTLNDYLL